MENVLEVIVERSRADLEARKRSLPESELRSRIAALPPPADFRAALEAPGVRVIAELKKASPSKGLIRKELPVEIIAPELERAGAAALSVLTERNFFLGSLENLEIAHRSVRIPLLRKDFLYDPYQVLEARAAGASAVLLIAAMLSRQNYLSLSKLAAELNLAVLAEAHTSDEVKFLLDCGAEIIGVNARDLRNFSTSLERSAELIGEIPAGKLAVAESAIATAADLKQLAGCGAKAFLIGEALMRAEHPGEKLCELLAK